MTITNCFTYMAQKREGKTHLGAYSEIAKGARADKNIF